MNSLDSMLQRNKDFAARMSAQPMTMAFTFGSARGSDGKSVPAADGLLEQLGLLGRIGEVAGQIPGGGGEFHIIVLQHTDCGITRLVGDPAKQKSDSAGAQLTPFHLRLPCTGITSATNTSPQYCRFPGSIVASSTFVRVASWSIQNKHFLAASTWKGKPSPH